MTLDKITTRTKLMTRMWVALGLMWSFNIPMYFPIVKESTPIFIVLCVLWLVACYVWGTTSYRLRQIDRPSRIKRHSTRKLIRINKVFTSRMDKYNQGLDNPQPSDRDLIG